MDFFASQEAARRSSRYLLLLFVVAIVCIAALANLAIYVILKFQTLSVYEYDLTLMWQINAGVLFLVLAGSAYRVHSLKRGGEAIAAALGGQLVSNGGADYLERRLINVVEEMAIASGLPVPAVYLVEEEGINAFAAGFSSDDAVIGVTRGAIRELNRDQLQGVVAHEFSHIIHGDMALNIRLVGLLHGIFMLSFAGRVMLQTRRGVARRSSGAFPILMLGLSLFLIGYIGKFFGDLIKAGVSRQREYLADASAVQYTRNNSGIAGALKRIGGYVAGSNVLRSGAEEFSHLYFSENSKLSLLSMLATHPPLDERIQRLEPGWNGEFFEQVVPEAEPVTKPAYGASSDPAVQGLVSSGGTAAVTAFTQDTVASSVGTFQSVDVAAKILIGIEPELRTAVRETYSVRAVMYGLFLRQDTEKKLAQEEILKASADVFVRARLRELEPSISKIQLQHRLPLIELALPALHQLSDTEYQRLANNIEGILKAAAPISLSDWALFYYLKHHMGHATQNTGKKQLSQISRDVEFLLSVLAHSDSSQHGSAETAFRLGAEQLELPLELKAKKEISIPRIERATHSLNRLKPLQKPKVLKAFVAVILSDNHLSPMENELIRCLADAIDCPLPPIEV